MRGFYPCMSTLKKMFAGEKGKGEDKVSITGCFKSYHHLMNPSLLESHSASWLVLVYPCFFRENHPWS